VTLRRQLPVFAPRILVVVAGAAFALGAASHAGITVSLGVTRIAEPTIVPAAIVEAIIALAFAYATYALLSARRSSHRALRLAVFVGICGVLLGMGALALGRGERTELNDVFHVGALAVLLTAWELTSEHTH
jgi:hypothetical protein